MNKPLTLSTGRDEPMRAISLGLEGYPAEIPVKIGAEVKKVPVSYFEKSAIECGQYVHPTTGEKFAIDEQRLDLWARKFDQMRAAGVEIPCPIDHSDKAEDNRGFTVKLRRDGKQLKFIPQVIGEDGALLAMRNRCSVKINPNFKDGKGREWGEAIEHIAFTPVPVIDGQGSFVPFAASRGEQTDTLYLSAPERSPSMDLTKLREAIGAAKEITDEQVIAQAAAKIGDLVQTKTTLELSRNNATAEVSNLRTRAETAETALRNEQAKVVELSKGAPDAALLGGYADLYTQKIDLALSQGKCVKAQADVLKSALKEGDKPNALMLSKSAAGTPIDVALKVLELNRPFTGMQTGAQPVADPNTPNGDQYQQGIAQAKAWQEQQKAQRGAA
jgi:hypothetical protein